VFDLDDFSRADPRRMHRYRMSSSGQLRRSRTSATPARVPSRPMATRRPPVQLAGYRRVVDGRRNPLRSSSTDEYAVTADGPTDLDARPSVASGWDGVPVDLDQVEPPARPLDWTPPTHSSHRTVGRSNPLR
jgi:hypothetical protein